MAGTHSLIINDQRELILRVFGEKLAKGCDYSIVDFPSYTNVGDSAIWLGAVRVLSEIAGKGPSYVCDLANFDEIELAARDQSGPIFINGGGNFGDIWPAHQRLRERLLKAFPDRNIIQMPQSISFKDRANLIDAARTISKHGNFTLLVRDQPSFELASANFECDVQLVPDMAFGLGPIEVATDCAHDAFMLLRDDPERIARDETPLARIQNAARGDWLVEPDNFLGSCRLKTRLGNWGRAGRRMETGRFALYSYLAEGRMRRGVKLLSSGKIVITDRLHAHIISLLLNKPHVVMDNNYGKIFSYINAWTHDYEGLRMANGCNEAVEKYRELQGA